MQSGKVITLSICMMILFNLLLAFGAVWSFQRMNPEIRQIYKSNISSLSACEDMLVALACDQKDPAQFLHALQRAQGNITEKGEKEALEEIRQLFLALQSGRKDVRELLVRKIAEVTQFNRQAIARSAVQAQKMRQAGAWGIVFMTLIFFVSALFFEQRLRRNLLLPLQEISQVMEAHRQGDKFRRCHALYANNDMKKLFQSINSLLDKLH